MTNDIRIAVVGAGLIGARHVAALRLAAGAVPDCIVDPAPAAAQIAAAMDLAVYPDLAQMLAARRPDGIILATPTPLHLAQGMTCIDAGIPVLIEKPITATAAEAAELVEAAAIKGIALLTGHHRRHNPLIARAKAMIDAGALGTVRAAQATTWFYKPDAYFDAAPWRKLPGAGPVSVNLVHDVDLLRHLCGDVTEVRAVARPSVRGYANEDLAAAILTFASGAIATLTVSDAIAAPWSWEMTSGENPDYPQAPVPYMMIGGSDASLSIPDLTVWRHQDAADWFRPMTATHAPCGHADPLVAQIEQFAAVIRGEAVPLVSGAEGARSLAVVEAVARAAKSGIMETPRAI